MKTIYLSLSAQVAVSTISWNPQYVIIYMYTWAANMSFSSSSSFYNIYGLSNARMKSDYCDDYWTYVYE